MTLSYREGGGGGGSARVEYISSEWERAREQRRCSPIKEEAM